MSRVPKLDQFAVSLHPDEVPVKLNDSGRKPLRSISRLPTLIDSLPTELLMMIFDFCAKFVSERPRSKHFLAWTQVCRKWRQIALNTPTSWQYIDLSNGLLARECLIRSGKCPIYIGSDSLLYPFTCELLMNNNAHRVCSINLFLFPDDMEGFFTNLGRSLSTLERVYLKLPAVSRSLTLDLHIPNVRHLTLDRVAIPWNRSHLTNLTSLYLRQLAEGFSPSISQIYEIFKHSPNLEYVRLSTISPRFDLCDDMRPIDLNRIREMILSGPANIISSILRLVSLPPEAHLKLYPGRCDNIATVFPMNFIGAASYSASMVSSGLRLAPSKIDILKTGALSWTEDSKQLQLSITSSSYFCASVLESLPRLINPTIITTLELGSGALRQLSESSLRQFLTELTSLTTLRSVQNDVQGALNVLSHATGTGLVCPKLSNMTFGKLGGSWWRFGETWLQSILDCVHRRQEAGGCRLTLFFIRCHGIVLEDAAEERYGLEICPNRQFSGSPQTVHLTTIPKSVFLTGILNK